MNMFPAAPVSVAIIGDHTDTFLSFHFESADQRDAAELNYRLSEWLKRFLSEQGLTATAVDFEVGHE